MFPRGSTEQSLLRKRNSGAFEEDALNWSGVYIVTLFLLCLYAPPTIMCLHLAMDPDAVFFVGHLGYWALVVPIFLLCSYWVQIWQLDRRMHSKTVVTISLVVPPILFIFMGCVYEKQGANLQGQLNSQDCSLSLHLPEKRLLQDAYVEAREMHDACCQRLYIENGNVTLQRRPLLQNCQEWNELVRNNFPQKGSLRHPSMEGSDTWATRAAGNLGMTGPRGRRAQFQYLASAEVNHGCAGFCNSGPMLWTAMDVTGRQGGPCAQMVGTKFRTVQRQGAMLMRLAFLQLFLTLGALVAMQGTLEKMGYQ